jgi:hypothetical protein
MLVPLTTSRALGAFLREYPDGVRERTLIMGVVARI